MVLRSSVELVQSMKWQSVRHSGVVAVMASLGSNVHLSTVKLLHSFSDSVANASGGARQARPVLSLTLT